SGPVGIAKEVVTPGMADRVERRGHVGNLLEDVAHSLYGPDGEHTRTWPTPTVRDMKGASQSFVQKGLETGHYSGLDGAVVGAAIEEADGIDDFLQALDGSDKREWPTPTASNNRKSRRAMTASTENGRRSGGGQSSPPALEQAVELAAGIIPKELEGVDPDTLPPATRAMWPTPNAGMYRQDVHDSGQYAEDIAEKGRQITLAAAADSFCNAADGFSPLGRFVQNDGRRPPRRTKEERNAARANRGPVGQLNPDWVEWLMGWPVGWTSMSPMTDGEARAYAENMPGPWWRREPPHVPRITVGTPDRAGRLKACGNGQVPLANAAAFEVLLETYRQIGVACGHVPTSEVDAFDLLGL
ncbi:MAG: hypothetical protein EBT79_10740, partial [Actinobacteria bacterium]|nr:hypothetical protein [Actinomycetota bacterium]